MGTYWALVGTPAELDSPEVKDRLKSPQVRRALVHTLELENQLIEDGYREGTGSSEKYGEAYSEYASWLAGTVSDFVDTNDAQGLRAITRAPFNPQSRFANQLAAFG